MILGTIRRQVFLAPVLHMAVIFISGGYLVCLLISVVHNYLCEIDALLFWELIAGPYILILTYAIVSTIRRRRRVTFLAVH
jgi:hypothetical protein